MKRITHVIGSRRLTADLILVSEIAESLYGRFSFSAVIPRGAEYRERLLRSKVGIFELESSTSPTLADALAFKRFFAENPTDIVHTHASFAARVGAHLSGIKKCLSTRAVSGVLRRDGAYGRLYNAFTSLTVCHSNRQREELISEGVRRDRIAVMPVDLEYGETKGAGGLTEATLVSPVPIYRGFGHNTLVRAFCRLPERAFARLVLPSEGDCVAECRMLVYRLGIGGRVSFYPLETLTKVYNNEKCIAVFPQEERWDLPTALLSPVRMPIVASDLQENRELFSRDCWILIFVNYEKN